MTYQELLEEFGRRRLRSAQPFPGETPLEDRVMDCEWAIQSILEKLRDGDKN